MHKQSQDDLIGTLFRYTQAISVALGHRDQDTRLHSDHVSQLSDAIGQRCGLSNHELGLLRISASLHDVGKIGIRDAVLSKPGVLDDAERAEMMRHSAIGEDIVLATDIDGAEQAAIVIRHHHEHLDGGGYPDSLWGETIPEMARIIASADSYDAMAVTHLYHKRRKHTEVMDILSSESGKKHDPAVLRKFFSLIEHSNLRAT